jgi:hypothetical protein
VQKSTDGEYLLVDQVTLEDETHGELKTVFLNGKIIADDSIETIRNRLANS